MNFKRLVESKEITINEVKELESEFDKIWEAKTTPNEKLVETMKLSEKYFNNKNMIFEYVD